MTEKEFLEKLQKETFKQYLKNSIDGNPSLSKQQKEWQKYRVDVAAYQADILQELMSSLHSMGLI